MTSAQWAPDEHLIDCGRAGKLDAKVLTGPDRSWVVAGLAVAGFTAEDTAKLLKCSLRLIRQIRAEPMTIVCRYALTITDTLVTEQRKHRAEVGIATTAVEMAQRDALRFRDQRDQLIKAEQRRREKTA